MNKTLPTESQLREAHAIRSAYKSDQSGRIVSPGKFEGEPIFAPYYWQIGLEGFADSDNGTVYGFRFKNSDADFALWPELKRWLGRKRSLKLIASDAGFVYCR